MVKVIIFLLLLLLYILLKKNPKIEKFSNSNYLKDYEVILYLIKLSKSNSNLEKISIPNFDKKEKFKAPLNKLNILENQISDNSEYSYIILIVDKFNEYNEVPQVLFSNFEDLLNRIVKLIEINLLYKQLLNRKPNLEEIEKNKEKKFSEIQNYIQELENYKKPDKFLKISEIYTSDNPKKNDLHNWEIKIISEVLENYQNELKTKKIQETLEKNIIPSPSPNIINIDNEYIIPPTISNNEKKDFVNLEFIVLNPNFAKLKVKDGKKEIPWEKYFESKLCEMDISPAPSADVDKCSCLDIGNSKICGKEYENYIFQCPYKCSDCGECHKDKNSKSYYDCKNKVVCKKYKDRIDFLKKYSVDDDRKFLEEFNEDGTLKFRIPLNRYNLLDQVFQVNMFNDLIVGEEFLMRLKINKELENVSKFRLKNIYFNGKKKSFDIFYGDNSEIYLFLIPKVNEMGFDIKLKLNGFYTIDDEKFNFDIENSINIFKKRDKPIIEEKTKTTFEVNSYLDDSYLNNYIGESELVSPHLLRNPVIINEVKNKELGEFEKKKMIDSPETWKNRADINRPWISTYSFINEDIFRKYNLDKKEKQYLRMVDAADKILLGNEYEEKDKKFKLNKEDIIKILKEVKTDNNSFISLIDLTDELSIKILNIMKQYKINQNKFKPELTPETKLIVVQDPLKKASMESQIPIITYQDIISNFQYLYKEPKKESLRLEDNKDTIIKLLKKTKNSNKFVITVMYIDYRDMFEVRKFLKKYDISKNKIKDEIDTNTTIILVDTIKNRDRLGMFNKQPVFTFKNFKDILK